jgi:tetratricopeptide (TPR) repeat protein
VVKHLRLLATAACAAILACGHAIAQQSDNAEVLTVENEVDTSKPGAAWTPAAVGQALATRDRLRTGEDSRAAVRLADATVLRVDELTETEILPAQQASDKPTLNVKQGGAYFFSREKSREVNVQTPAANGAIRGTEFVVRVAPNGTTTFAMLDGEVDVSNSAGSVTVRSGERAEVAPGQRPRKTAMIEATNIIQWCLYYPGVLNLNDLGLSPGAQRGAHSSLLAYSEGDLLTALKNYRGGSGSRGEQVYRAGLYLVVGRVDKAERLLRGIPSSAPGRDALKTLIAAVKLQERDTSRAASTASDWVAESYYRQSRADLPGALEAAEEATKAEPSFGFAWTRVAELQFSFGRVPQAKKALAEGLRLSPRNPSAHTLQGFLLAAENDIEDARRSSEQAIAIDGALGNAWLGRGLTRIRKGEDELGRQDLQTAAALEPNRSLLHSYLGKAFSNVGVSDKAKLEFDRAKQLDPNDPTPWLYSAIENRQNNRVNEAVRDLEKSQDLNDNRRVYRSRFLLEQDRAVRSANLAAIYQDAGVEDVAVREATRGLDYNYSNASSHLFLANAYNALRDPNRINLRFETPWFNELLLANLLSPVGGGPLSQFVSEQEYSKLFEADRFGISSTTEYLTDGKIREVASQFGIFGNFSYSLDANYYYDNGRRPNNEIELFEIYAQAKYQITPYDVIFVQTKFQDVEQGDLLQRYNQADAARGVDFRERQEPGLLLAGYRHQWGPGHHTLLLGARLADRINFSDRNTSEDIASFLSGGTPNVSRSLIFTRNRNGDVTGAFLLPLDLDYESEFVTYTGELNHIWETDQNTLVFGARFQSGDFETRDRFDNPPQFAVPFFDVPPAQHDFDTELERQSFYAYNTFRPFRSLSVTAGASYDRLEFPTNYRNSPIQNQQSERSKLSPKFGVTWNPVGDLVFRGAYARSLGGVSFDESVQLEPNQVAGFNQVFRSIISESVVGSVAAPEYETAGLLAEYKLATGTYAGIQATLLKSEVDRQIGTFDAFIERGFINPPIAASSTPQRLDYEEQNLAMSLNQLVGDDWSLGARYQLTFSDLRTTFREVPATILPDLADSRQKATLHQGQLFALYHHSCGFFARVDGNVYQQSNVGYLPDTPGDEFFQLNAYVGYRFRRNFGDVTLGFLNITDDDYQLNPLNYYNELPRERTGIVRVRLNF